MGLGCYSPCHASYISVSSGMNVLTGRLSFSEVGRSEGSCRAGAAGGSSWKPWSRSVMSIVQH